MQWQPLTNDTQISDDEQDTDRVLIRKKGDKYIAHSSIEDYQYRPLEFEDVPLYTWMRLMEKSKLSLTKRKKLAALEVNAYNTPTEDGQESNSDLMDNGSKSDEDGISTNTHGQSAAAFEQGRFVAKHPDRNSHTVRLLVDDNLRVPMFLGGPLPRHDRGDREDYCMTMLTLFKPWRTGLDLKNVEVSWNDTFAIHEFNMSAREKMKFFNTKYECLDAKDDYRAQRKAASQGITFDWMQGGDGRAPIHAFDDETDFDNDLYTDLFLADNTEKSRHELRHDQSVKSIKELMMQSGWMDSCIGGLPDVVTAAYVPSATHTAARWQAIVKSKKEELIALKHQDLPETEEAHGDIVVESSNKVRIVDLEWLQKSYRAADLNVRDLIDQVVAEHKLNPEQERAFRTVANHASCDNPGRLQMYLGGMGGTGKSEVLKAIAEFFERRHESYRFIVVAPTGSAASLLNGSTYHSVFGITDFNDNERLNLRSDSATKAKLMGVDYVFVDETSMLSCRDLYLISESASRARGRSDEPFGGLNLIFAGDFAQLPPVNGSALYSRSVGTQRNPKSSVKLQQEVIGKALWHLTTVVVMLTENMRQLSKSEDDDKLRLALENMRYKACTDDDIAYLKTRVAGRAPTAPKLASKEFRNVPVITAHNLQKDHINLLGAERFASENGQKLTSFYSIDRYRTGTADITTKAARAKNRNVINNTRHSDRIPDEQQEVIWALEPKYTGHKAGRLDLCIGMPVMLRYNEATECCMTNGANAIVVGWKSDTDESRPSLDALFVKLLNPPRDVQLDGLPLNVVPLVKRTDRIEVVLKNGNKICITRQQIPILLNFALTDYGAQGQTRKQNPVDLRNCGSYRGFYVALSRSATSKGLIIVSDFTENAHMIQGGLEGFVRQEYRELELLNEITKLKYEGKLPDNIHGHRRNTLIRQYQAWAGLGTAPKGIHRTITWSAESPMTALEPIKDDQWTMLGAGVKSKPADDTSQRQAFVNRVCVPALGSSAIVVSPAKKHALNDLADPRPAKKFKSKSAEDEECPIGFIQDNQNYSCAYDALFNILRGVWSEHKSIWTKAFNILNPFMYKFTEGLRQHDRGDISLVTVRNRVRRMLHNLHAETFPYGESDCLINNLALGLG